MTGWQCPRCGGCYAPDVVMCFNCQPKPQPFIPQAPIILPIPPPAPIPSLPPTNQPPWMPFPGGTYISWNSNSAS